MGGSGAEQGQGPVRPSETPDTMITLSLAWGSPRRQQSHTNTSYYQPSTRQHLTCFRFTYSVKNMMKNKIFFIKIFHLYENNLQQIPTHLHDLHKQFQKRYVGYFLIIFLGITPVLLA